MLCQEAQIKLMSGIHKSYGEGDHYNCYRISYLPFVIPALCTITERI
ncbi:hypothetical protein C8J31_11522 [Rhizobium sp. PP-CC-2G-626]|nr:hypothetical protein C8J31_11522 [Rhizobium sp. PP-CC-2G-626]